MKLYDKQIIFTRNVARLIDYIYAQNFFCTFGEVFRTPEQAKINALKGIGVEDSLHCKRLAIDINLFSSDGTYLTDAKYYRSIGQMWESLHTLNRWGGNFKRKNGTPFVDANHFEMQDISV